MSINKLTQEINQWVGLMLAPYQGDAEDLFCRFLGLEFSLGKHTLDNDNDCRFDDYRFEISTRTPVPDADLRLIQVDVMGILAFTLYRRLNIDQGMLVFDVQRLLARYRQRNNQWYDELSESAVVFPQHFASLHSRIEREGWK